MVDSSKSTSTYKTLIGLCNKITRLNRIITPEGINKLEDKLGSVCTLIKMHHYMEGQKYGYLASIISQEKYSIVISNNAWTHAAPANPGAYSAATLGMGNAVEQRKQFIAKHKVLQSSYANYLGMEEAGKELILYAVGDDALAPLKKQYIQFGYMMILSMLDHLCQKTAIRMIIAQKYEYKNAGFNAPPDPTTSITAYFTSLNRFQISLGDRSIATSNAKKTMAAGAQMWNSEMFTEDQMLLWENKPAIDQTWPNLQTYFTKKWLEWKQYLATTAKQSRFKGAELLARETAAAEEEGEIQVMLFEMLQEQHNKQMATMAASNKANMDGMMERMDVLVAAGGGRRSKDKKNTPPMGNITPTGSGEGGNKTKKPRRKRKLCPNCKMFVCHAPNKCYELEANKDTCYPRWTSVFAAK
jgi:hypothetical protein